MNSLSFSNSISRYCGKDLSEIHTFVHFSGLDTPFTMFSGPNGYISGSISKYKLNLFDQLINLHFSLGFEIKDKPGKLSDVVFK
ncbi:MAG: hypothetical protein NC816_05655 [Candidatus Omnitrophica bacterium]|nr:hypothetical protein [Candidatus Omnitrophota bacterium]